MVEISRNISLLSGGILLSLLVARFIILEDANLRPTSFAASKQGIYFVKGPMRKNIV